MGTGPPRYNARTNPQIKSGPMVTKAFRLPQSVATLFDERVAKLIEAKDPGVQNATDALQDAVAKWLLIEEAEDQARDA
jgi:hypothetical protein